MNAGNKNTPSTHHPRRRNVTTLMVGLKKRSHTQKSHPKVVNPKDIAGERKKKKKESRNQKQVCRSRRERLTTKPPRRSHYKLILVLTRKGVWGPFRSKFVVLLFSMQYRFAYSDQYIDTDTRSSIFTIMTDVVSSRKQAFAVVVVVVVNLVGLCSQANVTV